MKAAACQTRRVVADSDGSDDLRVNNEDYGKSYSKSSGETYRRTLNWYIGRRPRTAFSSVQVNICVNIYKHKYIISSSLYHLMTEYMKVQV